MNKYFMSRFNLLRLIFFSSGLIFCLNLFFLAADAKRTDLVNNTAQKSLANDSNITVYNQNRAIIKQNRLFNLVKGINHIEWPDLASTIDIHSVDLQTASEDNSIEVKEQNYCHDLVNSYSILNRCIGKNIYFKRLLADGKTEEQSGTLVGSSTSLNDFMVKVGEHYVLSSGGQIELDELPEGLVSKPEMSFSVDAQKGGKENLALTYEAAGINWQCDYSLFLNKEQDKFDMVGWATIDNQCGLGFKNTNLKLIAGSVQNTNRTVTGALARPVSMATESLASAPGQEQSFADYHLYSFSELVDLDNNAIKRLNLIDIKAVPFIKKYILEQSYYPRTQKDKLPIEIKIEFLNDGKYKKALPSGQIRVYQKDANNELQLIGADRIVHTPAGEKITVKLGEAFDILGERNRVNAEQVNAHLRRDTFTVALNNHSAKDITVIDREHVLPFATFKSDANFVKINSETYECQVKVPADGIVNLQYTMEYKI